MNLNNSAGSKKKKNKKKNKKKKKEKREKRHGQVTHVAGWQAGPTPFGSHV